MQCACAILSSVVCPGVPYFTTLLHTRHVFEIKLLNIKRVLIFSTVFVEKNSHSKKK